MRQEGQVIDLPIYPLLLHILRLRQPGEIDGVLAPAQQLCVPHAWKSTTGNRNSTIGSNISHLCNKYNRAFFNNWVGCLGFSNEKVPVWKCQWSFGLTRRWYVLGWGWRWGKLFEGQPLIEQPFLFLDSQVIIQSKQIFPSFSIKPNTFYEKIFLILQEKQQISRLCSCPMM